MAGRRPFSFNENTYWTATRSTFPANVLTLIGIEASQRTIVVGADRQVAVPRRPRWIR